MLRKEITDMKNNVKGITLIALTITIVLLLILAGISLYSGKETIEKAKLQELKTNMLLIQAKAKEYVEEVNFRMGIGLEDERKENQEKARDEIYVEGQNLKQAGNIPSVIIDKIDQKSCYQLTKETVEKWGLDKLQDEVNDYFLVFDEINEKVEVYYREGYEGKYSLTEIEKIGQEQEQ